MVLFLLAALLAMVHRRWFATGVFIALGTLTWQPVFFAAIARRRWSPSWSARPPGGSGRWAGSPSAGWCRRCAPSASTPRSASSRCSWTTSCSSTPATPSRTRCRTLPGVGLGRPWSTATALGVGLRRRRRRPAGPGHPPGGAPGRPPGPRGPRPCWAPAPACSPALVWSIKDFNGWPDAFLLLPLGRARRRRPGRPAGRAAAGPGRTRRDRSPGRWSPRRCHCVLGRRPRPHARRAACERRHRAWAAAPTTPGSCRSRRRSRSSSPTSATSPASSCSATAWSTTSTTPGPAASRLRAVDRRHQRPTVIAIGHGGVRRLARGGPPGLLRPRRAGARLGVVPPPGRRRSHQARPADRAR